MSSTPPTPPEPVVFLAFCRQVEPYPNVRALVSHTFASSTLPLARLCIPTQTIPSGSPDAFRIVTRHDICIQVDVIQVDVIQESQIIAQIDRQTDRQADRHMFNITLDRRLRVLLVHD